MATAYLALEAIAERRRLAIEALHRHNARLEEKLTRRDARIATLQSDLRTARARLRRIVSIVAPVQRKQAVLRERAVGE